VEHVLGIPTSHILMADEILRWEELHDAAVDGDDQTMTYVAMLEEDFDRRAEESLPTAEDIAQELEEFLRDQNDDDG
jgi:hypothetical protein